MNRDTKEASTRDLDTRQIFVCYSLTASDEPLQIRYVGWTSQPLIVRLSGHVSSTKQKRYQSKRDWFREVMARKASIVIRVLSEHVEKSECLAAEKKWWDFWNRFCPLLNPRPSGRRGPRYRQA